MKTGGSITIEQAYGIDPDFGAFFEADERLFVQVDMLLSASLQEFSVITDSIRFLIEERDSEPCDDNKLTKEIDSMSWFIADPQGYSKHFGVSRHILKA